MYNFCKKILIFKLCTNKIINLIRSMHLKVFCSFVFGSEIYFQIIKSNKKYIKSIYHLYTPINRDYNEYSITFMSIYLNIYRYIYAYIYSTMHIPLTRKRKLNSYRLKRWQLEQSSNI